MAEGLSAGGGGCVRLLERWTVVVSEEAGVDFLTGSGGLGAGASESAVDSLFAFGPLPGAWYSINNH